MKRQTLDGTEHEFTIAEEADRTSLLNCGAPLSHVNDMVMCDRQQALAIASGKLYYDYDQQRWMNV